MTTLDEASAAWSAARLAAGLHGSPNDMARQMEAASRITAAALSDLAKDWKADAKTKLTDELEARNLRDLRAWAIERAVELYGADAGDGHDDVNTVAGELFEFVTGKSHADALRRRAEDLTAELAEALGMDPKYVYSFESALEYVRANVKQLASTTTYERAPESVTVQNLRHQVDELQWQLTEQKQRGRPTAKAHNYEPNRVNGMGRCGCGQDCPTERAWMQHVASLLEPESTR